MKVLGKRQKKDRARARVVRGRVVEPFEEGYSELMAAAIAGVAFHASDSGPCDCWGDSVQWVELPFTREQLLRQSATQLLLQGVAHPPGCNSSTGG
jgi:hypothetical protein